MDSQYRLLLKPKLVVGPVQQKIVHEDDTLNVRDLTTRACVKVRARDVSIYRHTLLDNGEEFQILNLHRA